MNSFDSTEKMRNDSDLLLNLKEETKNFEFQNKKEKLFNSNIFLDLEELSSNSDELDNYEEKFNEEQEKSIVENTQEDTVISKLEELSATTPESKEDDSTSIEDEYKTKEILLKKGIFLTETCFPSQEELKREPLKQIKEFFETPLKTLKENSNIEFICIHSEVFSNGIIRLELHRYIEKLSIQLHSFSRGISKNNVFVFKKNSSIYDWVFNYENNSLTNVLTLIFASIYSEEIKKAHLNFTENLNQAPLLENKENRDLNELIETPLHNENKNLSSDFNSNKELSSDEINDSDSNKDKNFSLRTLLEKLNNNAKIQIYLPIINAIELFDSFNDSVTILIPVLSKEEFFQKNVKYFYECDENLRNYGISIVVYIFNKQTKQFEPKLERKLSEEEFKNKANKSSKLPVVVDDLKENMLYQIKVFMRFDKHYSAYSPIFTIKTSFTLNSNKILETEISDKSKNQVYEFTLDDSMGKKFDKAFLTSDKNNNNKFQDKTNKALEETPIFKISPKSLIPSENEIIDFAFSGNESYFLTKNSEIINSLEENKELHNELSSENDKNYEIINEKDKKPTENTLKYVAPDVFSKFKSNKIPICKIACNLEVFLALDVSGSVFSIGNNRFGGLGLFLDYSVSTNEFNKITFESNNDIFIYDVSCDNYSCFALGMTNGKQKIFSWGLGQGTDKHKNSSENDFEKQKNLFKSNHPIRIRDCYEGKIIQLISGFKESFLIVKDSLDIVNLKDSNIYCDNKSINIPIKITNFSLNSNKFKRHNSCSVSDKTNERIFIFDFFKKNFLSVIEVAAGDFNALFLTENLITKKREVYGFGFNINGQLGNMKKDLINEDPILLGFECLENPVKIFIGDSYSFILCEKLNYKNEKFQIMYRIGCYEEIFYQGKLESFVETKKDLVFGFDLNVISGKKILKYICEKETITLLLED